MARRLLDATDVDTATSTYPYGRARDKATGIAGTKLKENLLGDIFQFFQKVMALGNITPNSLPDNADNGFQMVEGFQNIIESTSQSTVDANKGIEAGKIPVIGNSGWEEGKIVTTEIGTGRLQASLGFGGNANQVPQNHSDLSADAFVKTHSSLGLITRSSSEVRSDINVYSKEESNTQISNYSYSKSEVYTKTETNTQISDYAYSKDIIIERTGGLITVGSSALWDMDTNSSFTYSLSSVVDISQLYELSIMIKSNSGNRYPISAMVNLDPATVGADWIINSSTGNLIVTRKTGGAFDVAGFNNAVIYIVAKYLG